MTKTVSIENLSTYKLRKLQYLCEHPLYGYILKEALRVWCSGRKVARDRLGFILINDILSIDSNQIGSCLLGAAQINKPLKNEIFALEDSIFNDIYHGFDNLKRNNITQAYLFGKLVGSIIFGDEG